MKRDEIRNDENKSGAGIKENRRKEERSQSGKQKKQFSQGEREKGRVNKHRR